MSQINIGITTQTGAAEGNLTKLEARIDELTAAMKDTGVASVRAAQAAEGSFASLERELKQNEAALKKMAIGSKEFDTQKAKVDGLRKSLAGAKGELGGIADKQNAIAQAGSDAVDDIKSMAMQFLTVQAVVQAISSELDHVRELKIEAAATTRTFEQALADIGQNVGAENIAPARQMILDNAPDLGVTQEGLSNIMGVAISAGAKDLEQALKVSAASLKLTVGDAPKAQALVGASLDVASLSGSENFEGAIGQLLQVQSQVRSTNLSEFAANIGSGLAAATAGGANVEGMSTERAFELSSVISQVIKDPTGANTATTLRQLVSKMDSFVPETEQTLKDGTVSKVSAEEIAALRGAKTVDDRMAVIQNSEGLSRQFLDSIEESIGKVAIREIVTKSERAVGFEEKAKANITGIDEAQGAFKNLTAEIGKETSLLAADRRHAAVIQKAEVTGGRATAGQVEKMVQETIDKMDLSGLDMDTQGTIRNRLRLGAMTGANPIDTGIQALEDAKQRRKLFGFIPAGGAVSEGDTQTADDTIAILRDMKAAQESQRQGVKAIAAQPEVKAGGQAAIVAEKRAEPITGTAIVEQAPAKSVDRSGLIAAQQTANEANADLTENKSGLTKQARQERADMANAALLEEQNRLMREQNELLKQQNQRPAQTPAPATVPVSVKVQAPATRPKEAPLPEKVQP